MASLIIRQKRKVPVWAWRFKESTSSLLNVLRILQCSPTASISESLFRILSIELHELSFESGATCSSGQAYFMPRTDGSCSLVGSRRTPTYGDDPFMTAQDVENKGTNKKLPLHSHLLDAFKNYALSLRQASSFASGWKPIMRANTKIEVFEAEANRPHFTVNRGIQSANANQCHRQIWMQCHDQTDDGRPSRAELIVLVSWMLGAMSLQKRNTKSCSRRKHSVTHHVFPTMVVSFQPRARVRILYAYFDGAIKVHFTKIQEFEGPDYEKMMDCLLRWSWPLLSGRTSTIIPLPTIAESDKESEEERPLERKESVKKPASPKRQGIKKRVCSFAASMSYMGKRQVPTHIMSHVCEVRA